MFQAIHRAVKVSIGHVAFSSIQTQRIPLGFNKILFRSIENPGCIYPFAKYRGEDLDQLGFSTIVQWTYFWTIEVASTTDIPNTWKGKVNSLELIHPS